MNEHQRQIDNKLLSMVQHHFPSVPLDERYTDWGKWLCFAREVYKMGILDERESCARICESQMSEPECPERAQYCADAIREHG